jgi:hypothetical protein
MESAMSDSKINVIAAVNEMRKRVEGVNREKKSGMMFETVSYDGLLDQIRDLSVELSLNLVPHKCTQTNCTPYESMRGAKTVRQNCDSYIFDFRLYHSSGEWLDVSVPAVGIDPDDKGPGKAMTYAAKGAWMQLLTLKRGKGFEVDAHSSDGEVPPKTQSAPQNKAPQYTADPATWPKEWQTELSKLMDDAKNAARLEELETVDWTRVMSVMEQNLNKASCPIGIGRTILTNVGVNLLATLLKTRHAIAVAKSLESADTEKLLVKYIGQSFADKVMAKAKDVTPF